MDCVWRCKRIERGSSLESGYHGRTSYLMKVRKKHTMYGRQLWNMIDDHNLTDTNNNSWFSSSLTKILNFRRGESWRKMKCYWSYISSTSLSERSVRVKCVVLENNGESRKHSLLLRKDKYAVRMGDKRLLKCVIINLDILQTLYTSTAEQYIY